jgi:hypothetical protein
MNYFHVGIDVPVETFPRVEFLDVGIDLVIAQFVPLFVLAVVREVLLDGVIGEVNRLAPSSWLVLKRSGPDVSVCEPVPLAASVDAGDHDVMPNIELPLLVEQRHIDIGLNDEGLGAPIAPLLPAPDDVLYILQVRTDLDPVASV